MPKVAEERLLATEVDPETGQIRPLLYTGIIASGANSKAIMSARVQEVASALIGHYPWVLDIDIVAIEQFCRAEARTRVLHEYIMRQVEEKGVPAVPAYLWGEASKAENNASRFAAAIGLSPEGRMKIAKDMGVARHFSAERVNELAEIGAGLRQSE